MEGMVCVKGLSKHYNKGKNNELIVLSDISFTVTAGEFIALFGPNGCGKSSMLNILGALDRDYHGIVKIMGKAPAVEHSGIVFQNFDESLFPWFNLLDNATFGLRMLGVNKNERNAIGMQTLTMLGLDKYRYFYPYQISGGMKQKTCIARALCGEKKLLLLDEPFSALDSATKILLDEELTQICENKSFATVLVSHDIDEILMLADRLVMLSAIPTTVRHVIDIELPRPRTRKLMMTKEYISLKSFIMNEFIGI
ncbi:MAG: ABC transporter ATP-binding protein [Magnetococcales bacterium]|nr:ABC transporter ATP-binding protein [Magnetococcales bacterium]